MWRSFVACTNVVFIYKKTKHSISSSLATSSISTEKRTELIFTLSHYAGRPQEKGNWARDDVGRGEWGESDAKQVLERD